jgi:excisionase family DNA binding protein
MTETDILIKKNEAASILRISVPTLERMVYRGELPVVKLGRNTRFKKMDLINYINRCTRLNSIKKEADAIHE